jgi:hypothetical protein
MKALGGRGYSSYSFFTSALDGGEWSASRSGRALAPGKGPPVPILYRRLGGPHTSLDTETRGKILSLLPEIEPRSPGRPARSQTLYRLSSPAHNTEYGICHQYQIVLLDKSSGSYSGKYEDDCLLGCCYMRSDRDAYCLHHRLHEGL